MSEVADAILQAKEEIYIAGWWLSPEIYLKRGLDFDEDMRLDRLLKKKAVSLMETELNTFLTARMLASSKKCSK